FTDYAKCLLTSWLCEQRRAGIERPRIDSDVEDLVNGPRPLPFLKRFTGALRCIGDQTAQLGQEINTANEATALRFLAETESKNTNQLRVCPGTHLGLHSFRSMRRIEASLRKASAL